MYIHTTQTLGFGRVYLGFGAATILSLSPSPLHLSEPTRSTPIRFAQLLLFFVDSSRRSSTCGQHVRPLCEISEQSARDLSETCLGLCLVEICCRGFCRHGESL